MVMAEDVVGVEGTETASTDGTQSEPTLNDLADMLAERVLDRILPQVREVTDKGYQDVQRQLTPLQQLRNEVREVTGRLDLSDAKTDALMKAQLGDEGFADLKERITNEHRAVQAEAKVKEAEAVARAARDNPPPPTNVYETHYQPLWKADAEENGLDFDDPRVQQIIAKINAPEGWVQATQLYREGIRKLSDGEKAESKRMVIPNGRGGQGAATTKQALVNRMGWGEDLTLEERQVAIKAFQEEGMYPEPKPKK